MPLIRVLLLLFSATVLAACGGSTSMPRGWPRVVTAGGDACPKLAGRYFDSSAPISQMLASQHVPYDTIEADWAYFELVGDADKGLRVTVVHRDSVSVSGTLSKGTEWSGDYYCKDGWLKVGDGKLPNSWDAEVKADDFQPQRRQLRIAPNTDGALVARLDFTDYDEFTVWCGDGCRGIPLPWTFRTRSAWSMAEPFDPDVPPPVARQRQDAQEEREAALDRARHDRVWQEEQLLENGPPDPAMELVRTRALAALVPGMLLRGVGPRDDGWHLSLEFAELYQLEQFMERLRGSGPVAELRVAPLYRTKTTQGRWTDVVFIRYQ